MNCALLQQHLDVARAGRYVFHCRRNNLWYSSEEFISIFEPRPDLFKGLDWGCYDPLRMLVSLEQTKQAADNNLQDFTQFLSQKGIVRAHGN